MDDAIIHAMEAEAQQLEAKLSAIRSVISLYRAGERREVAAAPRAGSSRATAPKGEARQTNVDIVRKVAIEVVQTSPTLPVPTRAIMSELARRGVEIAGKEPQNVVSSILSRTPDLKSNGRAGWTISEQDPWVFTPNENEPPTGNPEDGSETAQLAQF